MWIALGFLGVLVLFAMFAIGVYNGLVGGRNHYKNAFAQIDVQLRRRYDLIPNLVETAKGYLKHEAGTLEAVVKARNAALAASQAAAQNPGNASAMNNLSAAEGALTMGLGRLMVLQESYPDLKGDAHMRELAEELTATENKIAFARQAYNDAVTSFNTKRETFPAVAVAGMLGFEPAALLTVIENEAQREVPKVSF